LLNRFNGSRHWLDSACDNCNGLEYLKVVGAPIPSDHPCMVCKGKRQINFPLENKVATEALMYLDKIERVTASKIFAKLRG
tara:strand:- start:152 stop:394 length:243 start_codon:yes stop_codon:yes gene_type:complete